VLQTRDVELLVGDDLLESAILLFQLLQPLGLADLDTSVLAAPVVDRVLADVPASPSFRIATICSSVKRLLRMATPLRGF
jgi:hypothetical protein